MDHDYTATHNNISARPLSRGDIEDLRHWRNDAQHVRYMRKIPHITAEMQSKWFEDYLSEPGIYTFAIDETLEFNRLVGSVSLYGFRASGPVMELGKIMIDPAAGGKGIGSGAVALATHIGFERFGPESIDAYVNKENISSRKTFLKNGFEIVDERPDAEGRASHYLIVRKHDFYAHLTTT
jgi:RimJ/RimL family protein N-acetyltransferase